MDVCEQCAADAFVGNTCVRRHMRIVLTVALRHVTERIYHIEHPRLVNLIDEVSTVQENERGYWVSKGWLKGEHILDGGGILLR